MTRTGEARNGGSGREKASRIWQGKARDGKDRRGVAGKAGPGPAGKCAVRYGEGGQGLAVEWHGRDWQGSAGTARHVGGKEWRGPERQAWQGTERHGWARQGRRGVARTGKARLGKAGVIQQPKRHLHEQQICQKSQVRSEIHVAIGYAGSGWRSSRCHCRGADPHPRRQRWPRRRAHWWTNRLQRLRHTDF